LAVLTITGNSKRSRPMGSKSMFSYRGAKMCVQTMIRYLIHILYTYISVT